MDKLILYINTIKYLKIIQIIYRIYYSFRNKIIGRYPLKLFITKKYSITPIKFQYIEEKNSLTVENNEFNLNFINKIKKYKSVNDVKFDDWEFGELWCYELNYFNFLNQNKSNYEIEKALLFNWIKLKYNEKLIPYDPYPTSQRIVNSIKWYGRFHHYLSQDECQAFNNYFRKDINILYFNLEYHLLGNHLLDNLIALVYAVHSFEKFSKRDKILKKFIKQLDEQILDDGCHFELSTSYHLKITEKLLNLYSFLISLNINTRDKDFCFSLKSYLLKMLGWIQSMAKPDNYMPAFGDSTQISTIQIISILDLAEKLEITPANLKLSECGYRKIIINGAKIVIDCGSLGPYYIPGHAHCDALSFTINKGIKGILVDPGVSTYELGELRNLERHESLHNTITVTGNNQGQIWSRFRMGLRSKVKILSEDDNKLSTRIEYYGGAILTRNFMFSTNEIEIHDYVENCNEQCIANFHFHPDISLDINGSTVMINDDLIIHFNSDIVELKEYDFNQDFNHTIRAMKIIVKFSNTLITRIKL